MLKAFSQPIIGWLDDVGWLWMMLGGWCWNRNIWWVNRRPFASIVVLEGDGRLTLETNDLNSPSAFRKSEGDVWTIMHQNVDSRPVQSQAPKHYEPLQHVNWQGVWIWHRTVGLVKSERTLWIKEFPDRQEMNGNLGYPRFGTWVFPSVKLTQLDLPHTYGFVKFVNGT